MASHLVTLSANCWRRLPLPFFPVFDLMAIFEYCMQTVLKRSVLKVNKIKYQPSLLCSTVHSTTVWWSSKNLKKFKIPRIVIGKHLVSNSTWIIDPRGSVSCILSVYRACCCRYDGYNYSKSLKYSDLQPCHSRETDRPNSEICIVAKSQLENWQLLQFHNFKQKYFHKKIYQLSRILASW